MKQIFLMERNFTVISYLFLVFLLVRCADSSVESKPDNNLISNGSFEFNGTPTLDGWRFGNEQLAELVKQAPPKGGNWSLQLTSDWAPTTGFAYTPVTKVRNGDVVKLSAFIRTNGGNASIALSYNSYLKSAFTRDTVWTQISVTDTLSLAQGDTLWVILSSPITEIVWYRQLFDLVKLEKL